MSNKNPSLIAHISIGTNQFEKAREFYKSVLSILGAKILMDYPGAVCFGKQFPELWLQTPIDGNPASTGNGFHIGFDVSSKEIVNAFYQAAMAAGATSDGEPGPRPMYGDAYYGCFVRDLDGHKIEAAFHDESVGH